MSASGGTTGASGTPVSASQTATAGAINITLPAVAGKTNYLTGFEVTGGGATAGSIIDVVVGGIGGANLHYAFAVPTGATLGAAPLIVTFATPLQASAPNTAIVLAVPSFGAGNTESAAVIHGFVA